MKIQRAILRTIWRDKNLTRAVAMSLLIREKTSDIVVRGWSYARLSTLSGLSFRTIKKYINILIANGMAYEESGNIIFPSLKSGHGDRNVMVKVMKTDTVNEVAIKLRLMFINVTNQQKRYVNAVIGKSRSTDPNEVKKSRRTVRRLGWQGMRFADNGISMNMMARTLHLSRRTIVNNINKAQSKGWVKRILRTVRCRIMGISEDQFHFLFPSYQVQSNGCAIKYLASYYLLSPRYLTSDKDSSSLTGRRFTSDRITYYRTIQPKTSTVGW